MRHRVKGRKLSRTAAHRRATFRNLAIALIKSVTAENKKNHIITTVEKAKELRGFIEPLITRAKLDSHHNRKIVFAALQDKDAVTILFDEIGPKAKDRPGGYVRIIKAGFRQGDAAETAVVELVDYNDVQPEGQKTKKKRTRRSKSSTPKAEAATQVQETATEEVVEETAEASVETVEKEVEATEVAEATEETSVESPEKEVTAEVEVEASEETKAEAESSEETAEEDTEEEEK